MSTPTSNPLRRGRRSNPIPPAPLSLPDCLERLFGRRTAAALPVSILRESAAEAMRPEKIIIRGAREHNLKNITVEIPRDQLVVLTGVSGSGKSSLAFDTLYAEGQRRYVESLSSYARQFLGQNQKPKVDYIGGLSPAISIEQKTASRNPRSTVGTVTEIHDYLRVLYARVGLPHCPSCGDRVGGQTAEQIVERIMARPRPCSLLILAPVARFRKGEYQETFEAARREGFARVRVNGEVHRLDEPIKLNKRKKHEIEIVVDRLRLAPTDDSEELGAERSRLTDSVETALAHGDGAVMVAILEGEGAAAPARRDSPTPGVESGAGGADRAPKLAPRPGDILFSERNACLRCGLSFEDLSPQMFSFNSPQGACPDCLGLGTRTEIDPGLVVPDHRKSLHEGTIAPWGDRLAPSAHNSWLKRSMTQVCAHFGIDMAAPFAELTEEQRQVLLWGAKGQRVGIKWQGRGGSHGTFMTKWEGAIPRLKRRLAQTDSEYARQRYMQYMSRQPCPTCHGTKLQAAAAAVTVGGRSIVDVEHMSIAEARHFFEHVELNERDRLIADDLLREICGRLRFLLNVGLYYLTLDRPAPSLSGGEAQRIRLASQIGCGLVGVLYILDEPSIGLHQRDNGRLLRTLEELRDLGNTVVVVEHDLETMLAANHVIDFGPGAGVRGGEIVAAGAPATIAASPASLTGRYLAGDLEIAVPTTRRPANDTWLTIDGAREHNLRKITVRLPLGLLVCVTGVSGSGKSTLVNEILYKALSRQLMRTQVRPGRHDRIEGLEHLDKVIAITQDPIGRTPRSNPATYTGVFDGIRAVFAKTPEARIRGYKPGRFSFNVKGGRCEACKGDGLKKIEMQFLADVYVPCEVCKGKRFNRETLQVTYKGKTIADVLAMTVDEAVEHFANIPAAYKVLRTLVDVGLGYMQLGQPATTLSGGEAQRVKLAKELCRPATGRTLYVLDEPTTGLHFADIQKLLDVLQRLVEHGNTVVVIEHNMDVIKTADHLIDLGPEGGLDGGRVIATGTPEDVAGIPQSFTGQHLRGPLGLETAAPATEAALPERNGALSPERVRSVRKLLGMTQAEAARAVGVSRGLLAEAERGRRAGERTLTRLLEGLRIVAEDRGVALPPPGANGTAPR